MIYRYLMPSTAFISVYIFLVICPTFYIYFSDFYSDAFIHYSRADYRAATELAFLSSLVFLFSYAFGFFLTSSKKSSQYYALNYYNLSPNTNNSIEITDIYLNSYHLRNHKFFYQVSIISAVSVWIIFFTGGYEKIFSFGRDISRLDYRLLGDEDRLRFVSVVLQITRRLILPYFVIYFILLSEFSRKYSRKFYYFLFFSLIIGNITTLDRGPFMLMLVMILYIVYSKMKNLSRLYLYLPIFLSAVVLIGGMLTYIQYNLSDFSIIDALSTGLNFITNRAVLAPNYLPIELSYGVFDVDSDKLWLRYSRLIALFTGNYIGALLDVSLYITPVGVVADVWRNMGYLGIIIVGIFFGVYFHTIDRLIKLTDPITKVATSFTVISLVFYFFYGTFFSQGLFLQLIFIYFVLKYSMRDGKRYHSIQVDKFA